MRRLLRVRTRITSTPTDNAICTTARKSQRAFADVFDDQQHRQEGEVLPDQDSNRDLAGASPQLAGFLQHLDRDGGARQRDHEAQQDGLR